MRVPPPPAAIAPAPDLSLAATTVRHHGDADFEHPDAALPCRTEVIRTTAHAEARYVALCATHDCGPSVGRPTEVEAEAMMRCDLGRRWFFLVLHRDDHTTPEIVDLPRLWDLVRSLGMEDFSDEEGSCCDLLVIYRFNQATHVNEPLTLDLDETPGGFMVSLRADDEPAGCHDHHDPDARDYNRDGRTYLHEEVLIARGALVVDALPAAPRPLPAH